MHTGKPWRTSRDAWASSTDRQERLRIFTKLMALYPSGGDPEIRMTALMEETRDVPAYWISVALHELTGQPGRKFCPAVGEIKGEAAKQMRRHALRMQGRDEYNPHGESEINVERWLKAANQDFQGLGIPEPMRMKLCATLASTQKRLEKTL